VGCGGHLKRSKNQYDFAPCMQCGALVNTHINGAKACVCKSFGLPFTSKL